MLVVAWMGRGDGLEAGRFGVKRSTFRGTVSSRSARLRWRISCKIEY